MFFPAERLKNVRKSATRVLYDGAPPGSINLGLGEPDFPTPEVVRRAAVEFIEQGFVGYTPNAGVAPLRAAIAAYHSEGARAPFDAEQVCVMNGSEEALFAAVMTIAGPGDDVLLPDPCYLAYPPIAELAGARATYYRMPAAGGFAFDRESFDRAVTDRTKIVILLSPSNPTSRTIAREDMRFIAERLRGTSATVIADEIYRELYFDERPATISEFYDRTVIISGLSKSMSMTGWRLGWCVGPEEIIRHVTVMHQYVSSCASGVSQRAALAAFTDEGRRATAEMRDELKRRNDVMARAIGRDLRLPFVQGEGAYYVMLDVSRFGPSTDTAMAVLKHGVITVPGSAFGAEGEGYLRLSFSIAPSLIEEGIRRLAAGLDKLAGRE
ncbi:MAG TPA: aminotransferase class I/II-fold pyridoxal phosphate-dependent enzyme [Blastocatellia bacterium]|nr:aminotransferase class I/II-fold pyridoxal phosphate-dependent enzyme [Blastocatellia bacterium]